MNKKVDFFFRFTVAAEKQARYEHVVAEQLEISKNEAGTLVYDIFRNSNGSYCQHEQYADEAALLTHTSNTATQLAEWMSLTELQQVIALGPLSDATIAQYQLQDGHYLPFQSVDRS